MKQVNQLAFFNFIFSNSDGIIFYNLCKDYVNKSYKSFRFYTFKIDENGFLPKSATDFAVDTGYVDTTIRRSLHHLKDLGFVEILKNDYTRTNGFALNNISSYKPYLNSDRYLKLCEDLLSKNTKSWTSSNENIAYNILTPYIQLLKENPNFLEAIDMINAKF